jgi:hypothetical protein
MWVVNAPKPLSLSLCTNEVANHKIATSLNSSLCNGSFFLSNGCFSYWKGQDTSGGYSGVIKRPKGSNYHYKTTRIFWGAPNVSDANVSTTLDIPLPLQRLVFKLAGIVPHIRCEHRCYIERAQSTNQIGTINMLSEYPVWWHTDMLSEYSTASAHFTCSLGVLPDAMSNGVPYMMVSVNCFFGLVCRLSVFLVHCTVPSAHQTH